MELVSQRHASPLQQGSKQSLLPTAGGTRPPMKITPNDDGYPTHQPQATGANSDHRVSSVPDALPLE
jgi:hypothetical protein